MTAITASQTSMVTATRREDLPHVGQAEAASLGLRQQPGPDAQAVGDERA